MKVLLMNPPIKLNRPPEIFPLGLGYISSVLLNAGHEVEILDINGMRINEEEVLKQIEKIEFDIVGIGGLVTTYKYVKRLTHNIKKIKPKAKIVLGGGVGGSIPELALEKMDIDFVVMNEGEETMVELLGNIDSPKKVNGICYKENGTVCKTPERELIKDLDKIPFPAWDLFPMHIYTRPTSSSAWMRKINMIYGRGCPFGCTFCWHNFGYNHRLRSPGNIIEEIKLLKKKYKIKYITFSDECITVNKENLLEFCNRVVEEKLDIKWACASRVHLVDKEILAAMKKAGCYFIGYGVESGSQKMLDSMRKGATVEQAKRAILLTEKAGILPYANLMVGTPGETEETIRETVEFCNEMKLPQDRVPLFFTTPFPSSPLYEYAKGRGLIKNEEEYIEKLGDVTNFIVNLTDMPDEKLVSLRNWALKEISTDRLKWVYIYFRWFGLFRLMKSGITVLREGWATDR